MTKSDALKLEYRIKQVPASKKIFELIKGEDKMTMKLKKDLQTVNKELKALAKKVDRLVVAVGKLEKTKPARKPVAKRVAAKKPAAKKPAKTAVDTVFGIIKRYKKGVSAAKLMERTGFEDYKIHNIVYKLKNQGKIKSVGRGVYLKA